VSSGARRFARSIAHATLAGTATAHASLAYVSGGMEGVNRVLRHTTKPGVIPVLRLFGARIGEACDIEAPLVIHHAQPDYRHLTVGSRCHLGKDVFIDLAEQVTIADRVTVSMRAVILTHVDAGQSPLALDALPTRRAPVTLGAGCYIGAGAIILAGVEIGESAVIGAGAVVTRSVPPFTVAAGSPARPLRQVHPTVSES
jgi:acetyltransferase-like isoleucine patch superfamily enzyme